MSPARWDILQKHLSSLLPRHTGTHRHLQMVCWNTDSMLSSRSKICLFNWKTYLCLESFFIAVGPTFMHNFTKASYCLVTKFCLTLCDPMDCSLPRFSVPGILQARVLEWHLTISFSKGSSRARVWTSVSCTAGRFFTIWAPREAPVKTSNDLQTCRTVVMATIIVIFLLLESQLWEHRRINRWVHIPRSYWLTCPQSHVFCVSLCQIQTSEKNGKVPWALACLTHDVSLRFNLYCVF